MEMLHDSLGFAVKGFIVFLTVAASVLAIVMLTRRRGGATPSLEVKPLNRRFQALGDAVRHSVLEKADLKALAKERKKDTEKKDSRVYVLDFDGDIMATATANLREEVSALLAVARPEDEVVVRLESPGGAVPHYGLAAAQLVRLKDKKVKLTVCVDRVAASGGYMMACVADKIVAAPFSAIGSIGVVAQVPNFNRLLKKNDVDFEEMTAGEFKRTVTMFGEITPKGRQKFHEQLEETHALFKDFVKTQRPKLDIDAIATGEYWLGSRAKELNLVDEIGTSDEYLMNATSRAKLFQVRFKPANAWRQRMGVGAMAFAEGVVMRVVTRLQALRLQ
ncbi:MAG: protease SohB [Archangium sp.]